MTAPDVTPARPSPAAADEAATGDVAAVELRIPDRAEYLRLARFAAADAGTRAGLTIDAVDDLRLAVSETCSLLTGSGEPIALRIDASGPGLVVEGRGRAGAQLAGENGEMARVLVEAVVDEFTFDVGADRATTFRIVKRADAPSGASGD